MIKIEFEGTDGAGKTTGLKYFIEQARAKGLKVVETREVGNPHIPVCTKLREVILDPNNNLDGRSMELIFSAMRIENEKWYQDLAKSENRPDIVVSDRGFYSHLAYTDHNVNPGFACELYLDFLQRHTSCLEPDYVIYFQVSTETALSRRVKRGDKPDAIEIKGIEFQEKVRESFEKYLDADVEDCELNLFTIDANQDLENVKKQLDKALEWIIHNES